MIKNHPQKKFLFIIFVSLFLPQKMWADFKNTVPKTPAISEIKENETSHHKNLKTRSEQKAPSFHPNKPQHNIQAPVYFEAEQAEGSKKNGVLNLIGNVVITQDDTTLTSQQAQLTGKKGNNLGSGSAQIQRAIASGNVHILKKRSPNSPEIKALADEIEFWIPQRIMILKGKAKIWKGREFLNADTIEIHLNTGDIRLKYPHGKIDPHAQNQLNTNHSQNHSNFQVIK
jgi:lipopolysaccharide transport protein LptA